MKEYSRQQRTKQVQKHIREQIDKSKRDEGFPNGETVMYLPEMKQRERSESNSPFSSYSTSPADTPSPMTPMDATVWDPVELQKNSFNTVTSSPSPQMSLASPSPDAFPIALNDRDCELVDFWMENISSQYSASISQLDPTLAPLRDVLLSLAMTGPAAFQVIVLDYAALLQARCLGVKDTKTSILHRARAVRMVNECIQECLHRGRSSIPDLVAVLAMAITEDRFGTKEHSLIHARAAKHILVELGGPSALAMNRNIEVFAHWVLVTTEGFGYELSPPTYPDANRLEQDFSEFMSILSNARKLSFAQNSKLHKSSSPKRHALFRSGSHMHHHLSPISNEYRSRNSTNYNLYSRLASLLYMNLTLWDLSSCPAASEAFLKNITVHLASLDIDYGYLPSTMPSSLLFWTFLNEPTLFDSNRFWCVQRLISIIKQLSYERIYRIGDALLSFLSFEDDALGMDWLDVFDGEGLKAEALGFELGGFGPFGGFAN
jgi:hypothetical protein